MYWPDTEESVLIWSGKSVQRRSETGADSSARSAGIETVAAESGAASGATTAVSTFAGGGAVMVMGSPAARSGAVEANFCTSSTGKYSSGKISWNLGLRLSRLTSRESPR